MSTKKPSTGSKIKIQPISYVALKRDVEELRDERGNIIFVHSNPTVEIRSEFIPRIEEVDVAHINGKEFWSLDSLKRLQLAK